MSERTCKDVEFRVPHAMQSFFDNGGSTLISMLLFFDALFVRKNTATATGNNNLICICK